MPLLADNQVIKASDLSELGAYLAKRKADLIRTQAQVQAIQQDITLTESHITKAATAS